MPSNNLLIARRSRTETDLFHHLPCHLKLNILVIPLASSGMSSADLVSLIAFDDGKKIVTYKERLAWNIESIKSENMNVH